MVGKGVVKERIKSEVFVVTSVFTYVRVEFCLVVGGVGEVGVIGVLVLVPKHEDFVKTFNDLSSQSLGAGFLEDKALEEGDQSFPIAFCSKVML